jgi:hypothetical protein
VYMSERYRVHKWYRDIEYMSEKYRVYECQWDIEYRGYSCLRVSCLWDMYQSWVGTSVGYKRVELFVYEERVKV